jgi:hypothetical protein
MLFNLSNDIDPKVDFSFKKIFGNQNHTGLLINLLNGLFKTSNDALVKEVTILNPLIDRQHLDDKQCILDIRAKTDRGELLNIEMQIINRYDWIERSLYYWSKLYEQQLHMGDQYRQLKKTISISFLNFKLFDRPRGLSIYQLRERDDHELLTPLMQLFFIELPKLPNDKTELDQDLQNWVLYMNANNQQERQQLAANNSYINEAQHLLEAMARNPEERIQYEDRLKGLMDYHSGLGAANAVGEQRGIQIGEQRGIQIGEQRGEQRGITVGIQLIAKNMLNKNMAIADIAELTGLSIAEIERLKQ